MKTRLAFLVMLIFCFSCGTNNKPLSDAQQEKMKGEIKEVVNAFIRGIEEANADMVMEFFLDSPDFVDITNGMVFSYNDLVAMKPNFDAILNQKCTIVNEKYTFLDKLTVLYTAETKWSTNYKDGHSSVTDPQAFLIIFKKIDNKWKVIYLVDSNVEKNLPGESPKGLNQVELMKQFIGTWQCEIAKDTFKVCTYKLLGNGMDANIKIVTKGRKLQEGKLLLGYDKMSDKFIQSIVMSGSDNIVIAFWFTSQNAGEGVMLKDFSNPNNANLKFKLEIKSPDLWSTTVMENNIAISTSTYTRIKN